MTLNEALMQIPTEDIILFLGAGFCSGATNTAGRQFALGNNLCERLIEDGNIDMSEDDESARRDLGYISERYIETNTRQDLIRFLKKEFTCKSFTEAHKIIAASKWKKIYTTNYDNIIETVSVETGVFRESADPEKRTSDVLCMNNAVIHMNGYIGSLNADKLNSTFRLLTRSYLQSTLSSNDWAISLQNDITNAKCLIFVGYSMEYDQELHQIFLENDKLRNKCIFVTYNPSKRAQVAMKKFGTIENVGVDKFAKLIVETAHMRPEKPSEYALHCLKQINPDEIQAASVIDDKDVTDLFISGNICMEKIFSVKKNDYMISRECCNMIVDEISKNYRAVIISSDIGNGKSVLVREIEAELTRMGTVYYLEEISSEIQDDMNYIREQRGVKYIVIENYNRVIDSDWLYALASYRESDVRYILTVRTYLNNNLFHRFSERFGIPESEVGLHDVNRMTETDQTQMRGLLDKYSLWGKRSSWRSGQKKKYLSHKCRGEIKSVMLDLMKSENIQNKLGRVLEEMFRDSDMKDVTLLIFVCKTIAIDLSLNDVVLLLGKQQVYSASFLRNESVHEFFDFENNEIKLKSPLVAYFILQNSNYNQDVENIVKKILPVLDRHSSIERYKNMLRMIISYSNLRMIMNKRVNGYKQAYVRIYETAKSLKYHEKNPFFWLQYAMAKMDEKEYKTAGIYLENAEAYSHEHFESDSWQIDTHKARLLLEQTICEKNQAEAFENFDSAYHLLYNNTTPDRHYPLKQVQLFYPYFEAFYKGFSNSEKNLFLMHCIDMQKMINDYLNTQEGRSRRNEGGGHSLYNIEKQLEKMRKEIVEMSE